jgi:hypothetical protein
MACYKVSGVSRNQSWVHHQVHLVGKRHVQQGRQ